MGVTQVIRIILLVLMLICGIGVIVLVLMQKSNSDGTSALSGGNANASDSFYGKNKAKNVENQLKVWTYVSAIVLAVSSIVYYVLR